MSAHETLPPAYFNDVYAASPDPWQFATSDYERAKYQATLAALPQAHFARVFEIGCSIGVLTGLLAPRCDELLAVDVSETALQTARQHLQGYANVVLQAMVVPQEFPTGTFDLVLLSEVGYYWSLADLALAAQRIVQSLCLGAFVVLVHWTPRVHDYPLDGDAVHGHFLGLCGDGLPLRWVSGSRHPSYRIDVFARFFA